MVQDLRRERDANEVLQRDTKAAQERLRSARGTLQSLSEAQEALRSQAADSDAKLAEERRLSQVAADQVSEARREASEALDAAKRASVREAAAVGEAALLKIELEEVAKEVTRHSSLP